MPRKPGQEDSPHSERQRRWAFAAEARGELRPGTARTWSRRVKRRRARGQRAYQRRSVR